MNLHTGPFRQDHAWPEESFSGGKGNLYDSSTPNAMAESFRQLVLDHTLPRQQQKLLIKWLVNSKTGAERIRAGIPKGWTVGDKTGTGAYYGTTNDIAIIWPPHGKPIIMVVWFTSDSKEAQRQDSLIASVTRILINKTKKFSMEEL